MGFWDSVIGSAVARLFTPRVTYLGLGGYDHLYAAAGGESVPQLWRSQPHLRTVVAYVARNIAQLGMHTFQRHGEADRARDRTSPLARTLHHVDGVMTPYDLVFATVGDFLLYDRAYWWVAPSSSTPSGWMIRRLPPTWITPVMDSSPFEPDNYLLSLNDRVVTLPVEHVLPFTGYSPNDPFGGSPTVEALRQTLQEQIEAARYRAQVWRRGGRVSAVLQRPADAPQWSDAARERFRDDWYAKYTGSGSGAGGTPILEDGMTLNRVDFTAQEQQFVEAAKLSLQTVASAFHVNPTMVGQLDNANYANVREFRKMLYGDTLGPTIAQIEQRINHRLIPMLGGDPETQYVEFNIAEKLQGSFEEQAMSLQTSTGGPWMLRSEARARMNLPAIEGADELIVPLNVIAGGQASPTDATPDAIQPGASASAAKPHTKASPVTFSAVAPTALQQDAAQVIASFLNRQRSAIQSRIGAGAPWWDGVRWDAELASALGVLFYSGSTAMAQQIMAQAGIAPGSYEAARTAAFLNEAATVSATNINEATHRAVADRLGDENEGALAAYFDNNPSRATMLAAGAAAFVSGFTATEVGRQVGGGQATKTWVTGSNPRPSHAAMNGQTVPIEDDFSNGQKWPGSFGANADDVAGCNCTVNITIPGE